MKICFIENNTVIDHEQYIPLGKLTCDMLNDHRWQQQRLLEAHLDFLEPLEDTTAAEFLAGIENTATTN